MPWREDMRRKATGLQFNACGRLALAHPAARPWTGFWTIIPAISARLLTSADTTWLSAMIFLDLG
jgi:hypothetical protein